jgi:RNA polymerase sigma-70 factor (ECF subfamily)
MDRRDDTALMHAWVGGDEQAFAVLVGRHGAALKGYALRMLGNPEQAEDVFSDTFVKVARNRESWRERGTVRGWLFTITRRLCLDILRKRRTLADAMPGLVLLEQQRAWSPNPEARAALGQRVSRLELALGRLSQEHREVVLMRLVHGLSAKESAAALECNPVQVDSRLAYARRQLKKWLHADALLATGGLR